MGEALEVMRQGVTLKVTPNPALKGATFAGPSLVNWISFILLPAGSSPRDFEAKCIVGPCEH